MHRILHVIGIRWWSAIAAHAVELASAQRRAGRNAAAAALEDSPALSELLRREVEVPVAFGPAAWDQLALVRSLERTIRAREIDLLHVHTGIGHAAAEIARRRSGRRVALVRTRGDIRAPRRTPFNRLLYGRADATVVTGAFQLDGLARIGVPPERREVVIGPVDTEHFSPGTLVDRSTARAELGVPLDVPLVGLIARLSPVKGHAVAIGALGRAKARGAPPIHLLVAGEEFQVKRAALEALASRSGVGDQLHFAGRRGDVRELLSAIDVGLVASTGSEAICRIAGEMMASGLPVIASSVSVLPEMVEDGVTGRLVPPGDEERLAETMVHLIADEDERRRLGEAAERASAAWSFEATTAAYDRVYESASMRIAS